MMLEEVDMRQVVPPRCAFQPASALSVLHRILTKLLSLASGQYLLSHTPGSGHANLKRSTHNNTGAYDLHLAHSGSPASDVSILGNRTVPWIPLDTSILLPHHKKYYRVPATFEPKAGKSQPKVQQKQKKKKRKKKKKGQGQAAAATGKQN
ncbi:Little elongation complex subunit 2 [Lamellibrachia satsuma]|nr:Little elongation complex subunit 2 [Lamellibrachia satsuma]